MRSLTRQHINKKNNLLLFKATDNNIQFVLVLSQTVSVLAATAAVMSIDHAISNIAVQH